MSLVAAVLVVVVAATAVGFFASLFSFFVLRLYMPYISLAKHVGYSSSLQCKQSEGIVKVFSIWRRIRKVS